MISHVVFPGHFPWLICTVYALASMERYKFLGDIVFIPFIPYVISFAVPYVIADNQPWAPSLHVHDYIICMLSEVYPKGYYNQPEAIQSFVSVKTGLVCHFVLPSIVPCMISFGAASCALYRWHVSLIPYMCPVSCSVYCIELSCGGPCSVCTP
jgi:hypothetical protein